MGLLLVLPLRLVSVQGIRWRIARMKPYRRIIFSIGSMLLLLTLVLAGCSRQSGPAASDNSGTEQQMPFDRPADKKGVSPTASLLPASIPAGTPIAIRP